MKFEITLVEVISVAVGMVIGYKLKVQIANLIANVKKALASVLTVKP